MNQLDSSWKLITDKEGLKVWMGDTKSYSELKMRFEGIINKPYKDVLMLCR